MILGVPLTEPSHWSLILTIVCSKSLRHFEHTRTGGIWRAFTSSPRLRIVGRRLRDRDRRGDPDRRDLGANLRNSGCAKHVAVDTVGRHRWNCPVCSIGITDLPVASSGLAILDGFRVCYAYEKPDRDSYRRGCIRMVRLPLACTLSGHNGNLNRGTMRCTQVAEPGGLAIEDLSPRLGDRGRSPTM